MAPLLSPVPFPAWGIQTETARCEGVPPETTPKRQCLRGSRGLFHRTRTPIKILLNRLNEQEGQLDLDFEEISQKICEDRPPPPIEPYRSTPASSDGENPPRATKKTRSQPIRPETGGGGMRRSGPAKAFEVQAVNGRRPRGGVCHPDSRRLTENRTDRSCSQGFRR